jgi:F-type H+-transporting ATPase subunit b
MDATFHALGQLLIQALPTFFIVLLLHFCLKRLFFRPLRRVLAERDEATAGARRRAAEALDRADAKAAEYEEHIRAARNEIYKEQEEQRRLWREAQASELADSKRRAEALVADAKLQLRTQAEKAKEELGGETQALADRIIHVVLQGRES